MSDRKYKLLVPSGHSNVYRLEGAVGATPDVGLLRLEERCCRATLPPFIDRLIFNFVEIPEFNTVCVQNLFHLGKFFVVSESMRRFLEGNAGCEFDAKKIRTRHPRGERTEQYWAMKVKTLIECVEAEKSFARRPSWSTGPLRSFSDLAMEVKLADDVAPYFANRKPNTYYSYPGLGVQRASLDFSSVPQGTRLFAPKYWPQYLLVEKLFAKELERQCDGGTPGYYFWTLGFDDVSSEHHKTMQALR